MPPLRLGTVLGFVISYRTTSSFERYNEGRRFWSAIILASRTFSRIVWFHVPGTGAHKLSHPSALPYFADLMPEAPGEIISEEERRARALVEKKTVINLIEAFAISIKHYLRGEEDIFYEDLYHLVKFLPPYALPAGLPSQSAVDLPGSSDGTRHSTSRIEKKSADHLPLPVTSGPRSPISPTFKGRSGDDFLLPARNPPQFAIFDVFPFSLLVRQLTKHGKEIKGKKAARVRAALRDHTDSHNIPLEISLYLVRLHPRQPLSCAHPIDRAPTSLPCKPGRRSMRAQPVSIFAVNLPDFGSLPPSCFVELLALPHRLADRSRAYFDHAHPIFVLHPSVGRHHHLLFGSSLSNLEHLALDYDPWHNCGGAWHITDSHRTPDRH